MSGIRGAAQRVILLPGAILPAGLAYGALIEALDGGAEAVAKDLEVYEAPGRGVALGAFAAYDLDREPLSRFGRPTTARSEASAIPTSTVPSPSGSRGGLGRDDVENGVACP